MEPEKGLNPGSETQSPQPQPAAKPSGDGPVASQMGAVTETVRAGLEQAGDYISGGVEQIKKDVVDYTRERPLTALLVTLGTGLVLGTLMGLHRN